MTKQIFKPYQQNQPMLLPPSLEELIAAGHSVRVVNEMIEQIDAAPLIQQYKGGAPVPISPRCY